MTRKDYQLIAGSLREAYPRFDHTTPDEAWRLAVLAVARAFAHDNVRFDADRFYAAVGLDVEEITV